MSLDFANPFPTGRVPGWILAALSVAVALFSYRYLLGVGPLAPNVMANGLARPWLPVHVAAAATRLARR